MKLKLLFTGLVFSAFAANAQVATLNENFNSFNTGNTTFPQGGWSAVLPPMNTPPSPPPPMMIVYAEANDASNRYVSSYSGGNKDTPQYLVSPQIVAPTGDKTLSFKARRSSQNVAAVIVQVGLASSPTDMTTFVAVGAPVTLSENTYQTITRVIPSSSSSYIVFKTVNEVALTQHTATDFDDIVYDTTPVGTINENFNSFVAATTTGLPQNGWNKVIANSAINVYVAPNNGSNTAQFYAANSPGTASYLVAPKIIAPNGTKKLQFTVGASSNSGGSSTIEAGMVSNLIDMTTFTSLGTPTTIAVGSSPQTFTLDVPTSTKQYIVWKFTGAAAHSAAYVDDVTYDVLASLGTSDVKTNTNVFKFVINANNEIQFVGKSNVRSVKVYSASGNLVAQGAANNNRFDVSFLATGVYVFTSEDDSKTVSHSKFIKK